MPTTLLKNPVDVNVVSTAVGLQVSGTAAASTTGAGAKPSPTVSITGTPGQATTGSGVAAGAGADITISAGQGGSAVAGAQNGRGGTVTINAGAPGGGAGSAAPYGDVLIATTGGRLGVGTTVPQATLEISGGGRSFSCTRMNTADKPAVFSACKAGPGMTAITQGHEVAHFTFSGYDGSGFVLSSRLGAFVDGPVTPNNVPTGLSFFTGTGLLMKEEARGEEPVLLGDSNAVSERMRITSSGNVGIGTPDPTSRLHVGGGMQVGEPTGGDMGAGTINVSGDLYKNGAAFTNPDYVFEHHFAGATDAPYNGPVPLALLEETIKAQGQLPGVGREPMGVFGRQDALLEKLEEAYLYIIELTKRVEKLEKERGL